MRAITSTSLLLACVGSLTISATHAETQFHRVVWDADPARQAVIGFSPVGTSQSPYVTYGFTPDESTWQTQDWDDSYTFQLGVRSYFVRLRDLPPNSPVYYRVCDQDGCGQHFWFQTAPIDNTPFVVIAGGDTRSGWTNRRKGNALVAKIRPLFIMHGGDYTMINTSVDMVTYLDDWELTFSDDTIDGVAYKRIYPKVPTHGNHEDNNYYTLCQVFGVDYNQDGECSPEDTYSAFNVSPLLRVYTLNSQFTHSGAASRAEAMNNWLANDLAQQGPTAVWRFAQYHRPMFPHYSGKSDNPELFDWWAQRFYDHAVNLVVESDTHINKLTWPVKPSGESFAVAEDGGTLYVGEGSWGAPSRSANNPHPWTIDLASIQQFKVIQVEEQQLTLRTAQFDDAAETLSRQARQADPLQLPDKVNWWQSRNVGAAMVLERNEARRTTVRDASSGEPGSDAQFVTLAASDDTYISESSDTINFNENVKGLLADGLEFGSGELMTLLRFDLTNLPSCINTEQAQLVLMITDTSGGDYELYRATQAWSEDTATWESVGGEAIKGELLGSFVPSKEGSMEIDLSQMDIVNTWLTQGNFGLVIASAGSIDGADFDSKETGDSPVMKLSYNAAQSCEAAGNVEAAALANEQVSFRHGEGEKVIFSFQLTSDTTAPEVRAVRVALQAEGEGALSSDSLALYADANGDGKADAGERVDSVLTEQDGELQFEFSAPLLLPPGATRFLITYVF